MSPNVFVLSCLTRYLYFSFFLLQYHDVFPPYPLGVFWATPSLLVSGGYTLGWCMYDTVGDFGGVVDVDTSSMGRAFWSASLHEPASEQTHLFY